MKERTIDEHGRQDLARGRADYRVGRWLRGTVRACRLRGARSRCGRRQWEYLKRQGWKRAWGVGRHILGSQLFDYWRDPEGAMLEHFADGDLFDASVPTGTSPFSSHHLAQWGPQMPADFIAALLTPQKMLQLFSALRDSEDLSMRKLLAMKKALPDSVLSPIRTDDGAVDLGTQENAISAAPQ